MLVRHHSILTLACFVSWRKPSLANVAIPMTANPAIRMIGLTKVRAVRGSPRVVDCSPILASLDAEFPALNIEGTVVSDAELRSFQRGNQRHPSTP